MGLLVCRDSHGNVFCHVSVGSVPKNNDCPMPPPPVSLWPPASLIAESVSNLIFLLLSATSRLPGKGASRVRQPYMLASRLLIRPSISPDFVCCFWTYRCHPNTCSGGASLP